MECRPSGFGTFAVVHRLKTDHLTITKKGGKVASSVDGRLCIQCRPGAFKYGTNFTLQVMIQMDVRRTETIVDLMRCLFALKCLIQLFKPSTIYIHVHVMYILKLWGTSSKKARSNFQGFSTHIAQSCLGIPNQTTFLSQEPTII